MLCNSHTSNTSATTSENDTSKMSLRDLAPTNSQKARATAISAFCRFLGSENTDIEFINTCLVSDATGSTFLKLLDRFALYLAFSNGQGGKPLARNSVMSYFRQVKDWLLDLFPKHRPVIEKQLLKQGRILERYCLKRQQGGMVVKAPACTKRDLRILIDGLYYEATSSKEYQDASCWH